PGGKNNASLPLTRGRDAYFVALVSATATAAITTPAATAARATPAAAALLARLGLVDCQGSALDVFAVQRLNGRLGLLVRLHLHEAEPLRPASVAVHDDLRGLHRAVRREHLFERAVRNLVGKVTHIQLLAHLG